jgi:hypothetical protein
MYPDKNVDTVEWMRQRGQADRAEEQTKFDPASCNFPVYAIQGGGYATYDREADTYYWLAEISDFIEAQVGDPIREDWGTAAANKAARDAEVEAAWIEHEWGPQLGFCDFCGNRGCGYCFGSH